MGCAHIEHSILVATNIGLPHRRVFPAIISDDTTIFSHFIALDLAGRQVFEHLLMMQRYLCETFNNFRKLWASQKTTSSDNNCLIKSMKKRCCLLSRHTDDRNHEDSDERLKDWGYSGERLRWGIAIFIRSVEVVFLKIHKTATLAENEHKESQ